MPLAKEKNIIIKNNIHNDFQIYADFISINRILANLISNSIEHLEQNKIITISSQKFQNFSKIIIEDNGKGIKKEDLNEIFEKYKSNNKSSKKIISGLGLYIVKELVEKNSGTITVESKENEYTKFEITLLD